MVLPIDRTTKTTLDSNLVNGITSDAPTVKASNDNVYNTIDELNSKVDTHTNAATLAHPDSSVVTAKLANGAVTTAKLLDGNVTTAKIADANVTTAKVADLNITTTKLADGAVTPQKLATGGVGSPQLADGSVTPAKIPDGTLTASKFVAGALTNDTQNGLAITALKAQTVKLGHTDHNGATANDPMIEIGVVGAGAALHLLCGAGMTAPYALGIGVDNGTTTGYLASVKAGGIGMATTLETQSTAGAIGFLGQSLGPGTLAKLVQGSGAHGSLLDLQNNYGGTGNMLSWSSTDQNWFGKIGSNGDIVRTSGSNGSDYEQILKVGSTISDSRYHWSGSPGLWFYSAIVSYSNRLILQQAAPAAIGSEAPLKLIEMMDGNKLGFFGVAPVVRQTVANSTDTSNAATVLNNLLTALRNYGVLV